MWLDFARVLKPVSTRPVPTRSRRIITRPEARQVWFRASVRAGQNRVEFKAYPPQALVVAAAEPVTIVVEVVATFLLSPFFSRNITIMNHYCLMFFLCFTLPFVFCDVEMHSGRSTQILHSFYEERNLTTVMVKAEQTLSTSKNFLMHGSCTNKDISISQSRESASGIPEYIVQIVNTCVSECAPYDIHLRCGWFASARVINPRLFKRLSYDDCLVNGGKPLAFSQIVRFTYSNSFLYPLAFKSAKFCSTPK
ncbi:uncharacterized protein LOC130933195 [Arachis stenosperma]|uniref:uncharacterized protein LOC130933195 n=1 Tax=Arachis stenosperma TaxID=217475 RepID=UPI0025ABF0ED|nr:uncharacterized protein LOC130933195 [Arachis stenosperma]